MEVFEVVVPYTNEAIWYQNDHGQDGFSSNRKFDEWVKEKGLWYSGLWYDYTERSPKGHRILIFEKRAHALLFKLTWM